ncbi:MAG: hypothetical protein ACRCZ2_11395 [Fusobacteriaceae bacterium]
MISIKNEKFKMVILIILFPFLLIILLKFIYLYLPGKEIGSQDGWLSFIGGYSGGVISIFGIWWQINRSEDKKKKNFIEYIKYILKTNLEFISGKEISRMYQHSLNYMVIRGGASDNKYLLNFDDKYIQDNLDTIISNKNNDLIFNVYRKIQGFNELSKNHFELEAETRKLMAQLENHFDKENYFEIYEQFRLLKLISLISEKYHSNKIDNDIDYHIKEINCIIKNLEINFVEFKVEYFSEYTNEKSIQLIEIILKIMDEIVRNVDDVTTKQKLATYITYCRNLNGRFEKIKMLIEELDKKM